MILETSYAGYAVVFERAKANYAAYIPDLPGCISTGKTLEQCRRSIAEAIVFHLEGMQIHGAPIPRPRAIVELSTDPAELDMSATVPAPGPMYGYTLEKGDPCKYRLKDLETGETWVFVAAGGEESLVPVATSGGPVLLPVRAEGPDGTIGDGAVEIFPGHALYEQRKAEIESEQRLARELRTPSRVARGVRVRAGKKRDGN